MDVYLATNRVNGKPYVGKTEKTMMDRWGKHLGDAKFGSPMPIHRAIRKYGNDAFALQIIEHDVPTVERLNELETIWIFLMDSKTPHGYNLSDGGEGQSGFRFSRKSRKRMSEKRKGRKLSAETRSRIAEGQRGKSPSVKTRKKISRSVKRAAKKHPISEETRQKLSTASKAMWADPEYCRKVGDSLKAWWKEHPECHEQRSRKMKKVYANLSPEVKLRCKSLLGKHHSAESIQKMRVAATGRTPTAETCKKIGDAQRGVKRQPHKPETIAKMKAAWALRKQRLAA